MAHNPVKRLYLASSFNTVAGKVGKDLVHDWKFKPKNKRAVFIDTAAEPEEGDKQWLKDDRKSLENLGFQVSDFTLTDKKYGEVKQVLEEMDVIFVSGGNTFYLLEKIQLTGTAELFNELVNKGKIYIGSSAGSIIAGPDISPVRKFDAEWEAPKLKNYKGLGLVDFVVLPHWGSVDFKKVYMDFRLKDNYNSKNKLILLADNQYVAVKENWYNIIAV